jgi:hypothetical protein
MRYFTSDTHYWHANIMTFCDRPSADVHHMNVASSAPSSNAPWATTRAQRCRRSRSTWTSSSICCKAENTTPVDD